MRYRKYLVLFLVFVMIFSLTACDSSKKESTSVLVESVSERSESKASGLKKNAPAAEKAETEEVKTEVETESTEANDDNTGIFAQNTYWTAYLLNDGFGVEELPADDKWIDLILWADGSAQLRAVYNDLVLENDLMLDMTWKITDDVIDLYVKGFDEPYCQGTITEEGMELGYYSDTLYLRQDTMPAEIGALLSPAQMAGTWILTSTMVEGDEWDVRDSKEYGILFFNSVYDDEIAGLTLAASSENRMVNGEMREGFYDRGLTVLEEPVYEGCGNDVWSVRIGEPVSVNADGYPKETEHYATLTDENTLLLQKYFTIDGGPGVSYSYYKRILPTLSVWELETAALEGSDWNFESFRDADGIEFDAIPGINDFYVHLDVFGECSVSWEDTNTGEYVSGDAQWILGKGGGLLIYQENAEDLWFSGAVLMHNIETAEESIYQKQMYLYYDGGIIKLVHAEGSGGENYGGEGVLENYDEDYLYLEQMAQNADEGSFLVLYGDEFLDMGVYSELPHYNCSKNGENSHNLLITALYDETEIYIVEENGEQILVDYLDALQSLVVRVDIPERTQQYLGFWADGESFIYDINQEYIDVTNWTYLTR